MLQMALKMTSYDKLKSLIVKKMVVVMNSEVRMGTLNNNLSFQGM
jgi:hypothetical protein